MEGEGGGGEGGREIGHDRVYKSQTDYFFLLFFVGTIERFSEDSLTEGAQEQVSRTRSHTHTGGRSGKRSRMDGSAGIQPQARRWPFYCVLCV